MLKPIASKSARADGARFAIIASRYNGRYVDAMLRAALAELRKAGVKKVEVTRVPGAFEIPVVAARLAGEACNHSTGNSLPPGPGLGAIICLGVILRGETAHAAHIGEAVTHALMDLQLQYRIPIIHTVLLLENDAQARVRCLDRKHNRGIEATRTALTMATVMKKVARS